MLEYTIEQELWNEGYQLVCGVDEAGRGPLCGPVVAAAVILPRGLYIEGLNDSKKISPKKRDKLFDLICENAIAYSIASASVEEIDELVKVANDIIDNAKKEAKDTGQDLVGQYEAYKAKFDEVISGKDSKIKEELPSPYIHCLRQWRHICCHICLQSIDNGYNRHVPAVVDIRT